MITSSGARCDVCGKYISLIDREERVNTFSIKGIGRDLHADNKCKALVLAAAHDWELLPDGPLREAFEEAQQ